MEELAAFMLTRVPHVSPKMTVQEARESLVEPSLPWESIIYLYAIDEEKHLIGVLSIKELFHAPARTRIQDLMKTELIAAYPGSNRERIARKAITYGIKAIPIVDRMNVLLGVVGTDTILTTLHEKHVEDFLKRAGVLKTRVVTDVLRARFIELLRTRLPWLVIGLLGALIATLIVRSFETTLAEKLAIAFFIPLIVYMSSAMGTQTQMLYIRGLIMDNIPLKKFLVREVSISLAIGTICALILFGFALFFFEPPVIAWIVSSALLITMLSGSLVSIIITSLLVKMKKDPALGGGPFATILQDITSLLIYLLVATALL